MASLLYEAVEAIGDTPQPRFGHTITAVSSQKAVLFGGATGDTGKYTMTGDTYVFTTSKRCWLKLSPQGIIPSPRAAHAATAIEALQLVVYGGATGGLILFPILFVIFFACGGNIHSHLQNLRGELGIRRLVFT